MGPIFTASRDFHHLRQSGTRDRLMIVRRQWSRQGLVLPGQSQQGWHWQVPRLHPGGQPTMLTTSELDARVRKMQSVP
jgi:hypothetical protein